jgi:tRNA pseudouridine55 synthase
MDGIIVLDKPQGISSHDAVQKMRRIAGIKRVGHLGTLDPIGTGVLPLVLGKATRLSRFFLNHDRAYEADIRFGFSTDTYDVCGEATSEKQDVTLAYAQLDELMAEFRGTLSQTPPPVSAKKIGGVPAYKLARRNKPVTLEAVEVKVYEFALLKVEGSLARVTVRCSAGTYLRSLAHDMGQRLGCGAHVEALRRTAMGEFTLATAYTVEQLEALRGEDRLSEALLAPTQVLPEIPLERVDAATASQIAHGRDFRVSPYGDRKGATHVKAVDPQGRLVAIGEARLPLLYHPIVVL